MQKKADRRFPRRVALASVALCAIALAGCEMLSDSTKSAGRSGAGAPSSEVSTNTLLDLADKARMRGDAANAVTLYRRVLANDSDNTRALIGLGEALNQEGLSNDAFAAFSKAIDSNSKSADALRGMGATLLALNKPQQAMENFDKSNAISPNPRAFDGLGVAHDLLGDFAGAKTAYQQGLNLSPNDLLLRNNLGLSEALAGDYDAAITTLRTVATDPQAGPRQRSNLALALALAGRTDQAAEISRIDLDDVAVKRNLAYYAELRGLPPQERAQALLRPDKTLTVPTTSALPNLAVGPMPPANPVPAVESAPLPGPTSVMPSSPPPKPMAAMKPPVLTPPAMKPAVTPPAMKPPVVAATQPAKPSKHRAAAASPPPPSAAAPAPKTTAEESKLPRGKHWSQVGTFRVEANARKIHDKVLKEQQDLITGMGVEIDHTELAKTHEPAFRVVIGPMDNRAQARKLCSSLTERKVDCIPVKF